MQSSEEMPSNPLSFQAPSPDGPNPERIEQFYTREILSGALPPGTRLPPSNEIAKTWSVSATVVQRAMRRLSSAGLVDRERKSGTVVRDRVERALIGLVIGPSLADETAHYFRAISTAIESLLNRQLFSLRVYDGVHPMSLHIIEDYYPLELLKIDCLHYQVKGLILLSTGAKEPPEIAQTSLPKVQFEFNHLRTSDIRFDVEDMAKTVLDEMQARHCNRHLIISNSAEKKRRTDWQFAFDEQASRMKGVTLEYLTLPLEKRGHHVEELAFRTMQSIIRQWQENPDSRPDSIFIMDDIQARGVCMALLQGQVHVPDEMKVVVNATDSIVHHYGMPVYRYEHSAMEIASKLHNLLWARISGETEPEISPIKGVFKERL